MSPTELACVNSLLSDWFGELQPDGHSPEGRVTRWWSKDPDFDAWLRETYGSHVDAALDHQYRHWVGTPRSWLALLLLLDQLTRNIFRDTHRMYAGDEQAVAVCREGLERGLHLELPCQYQVFALMPLMHAEDLDCQRRCVDEFAALMTRATPSLAASLAYNHSFAIQHLRIVERFGHFPHRNELIGRASTDEELLFLKTPGSSF